MVMDLDVFNKERVFTRLDKVFRARTDQNARDIVAYVDSKVANVSPRRLVEYYLKLGSIEKGLNGKNYRDMTKEDMLALISILRQRQGRGGLKISSRSLNNYKDELRGFMKFLKKHDVAAEIKNDRLNELNSLTAEDMLTSSDIDKLIRAASTPRNKAIIALYTETGMRPSELFNLQIKDYGQNSGVKTLTIFGKKRKRVRPIVGSVPYLAEWLNNHPQADKPEAPLFVKSVLKRRKKDKEGKVICEGEKIYAPLPYAAVLKMIRTTFRKAGVNKPATAKIFRHSTNTNLYGSFSEEVVRQLQGHVPGSQMARHYSHLNSQRVSDAYLSIYGIEPQEKAKPLLMAKKCMVCGLENRAENSNCERCKNPLTLKSALELSSPNKLIAEALSEDNELLKQLEEKLAQRVMKQVEDYLNSHPFGLVGQSGGIEI